MQPPHTGLTFQRRFMVGWLAELRMHAACTQAHTHTPLLQHPTHPPPMGRPPPPPPPSSCCRAGGQWQHVHWRVCGRKPQQQLHRGRPRRRRRRPDAGASGWLPVYVCMCPMACSCAAQIWIVQIAMVRVSVETTAVAVHGTHEESRSSAAEHATETVAWEPHRMRCISHPHWSAWGEEVRGRPRALHALLLAAAGAPDRRQQRLGSTPGIWHGTVLDACQM